MFPCVKKEPHPFHAGSLKILEITIPYTSQLSINSNVLRSCVPPVLPNAVPLQICYKVAARSGAPSNRPPLMSSPPLIRQPSPIPPLHLSGAGALHRSPAVGPVRGCIARQRTYDPAILGEQSQGAGCQHSVDAPERTSEINDVEKIKGR